LDTSERLPEILQDTPDFLTKILSSNEFHTIKQQVEEYRDFVQQQWEENYPRTAPIIEELTGIELKKEMTVKLSHPDLGNGHYMGDDSIGWGSDEKWDNYSTVYLWHEALHSYLGYSAIDHSLIQFLTNYELRIRLNNEAVYASSVGHEYLKSLMGKISEHWTKYRDEQPKTGRRDIKSFAQQLRAIPEIREEEQKVGHGHEVETSEG
jgi:hypothetical protein